MNEIKVKDSVGYDVIDMSEMKAEDVVSALANEFSEGHLLHGSNYPHAIPILEPRQALDLSSNDGNRNAIYATSDNEKAAIFRALFNKDRLSKVAGDYLFGWTGASDFKIQTNQSTYDALLHNYDELFSDGYIYVFDQHNFEKSKNKSEYYSESAQKPLKAYKVSSIIAKELFRINTDDDTIVLYSEEDLGGMLSQE